MFPRSTSALGGRRTAVAVAIIALTASTRCCAAPHRDAPTSLHIGRVRAEFRSSAGLYLTYDGIPVLRGSLLQVFARSPGHSFSSGATGPTVTISPNADGGGTIEACYRDVDGARFEAIERVEVGRDETVSVNLSGNWTDSEPATFEWAAGKVWAYPLVGADWTSDGPSGHATGRILQVATGARPGSNVAEGFRTVRLHGRAFELELVAGTDSPDMVFFDGRKDPNDWARDDRVFWLGCVGPSIVPGQPFSRTIHLTFHPIPHAKPGPPVVLRPRIVNLRDARSLDTTTPILIPRPKRATIGPGQYAVPTGSSIVIIGTEARLARAAREFGSEIGANAATRNAWVDTGIRMAVVSAGSALERQLTKRKLVPPTNAEGYRLQVDRGGIALTSRSAAGAYYGLQTLRELMRTTTSGVVFRTANITDWPSLGFRGAHLFVGNHALPFHKKLVERILSRYKMNALVLECEYTKWDTAPGIATPFSMSKSDLAADVRYARDHFMEPIPLVNSLGHAEWMFQNGRNADLVEDPDHRTNYCARNEGSYRFIQSVYQEALDLFKPRWFHIGHDEITLFGRFPNHPECIAAGPTREAAVTNLFLGDIKRLDTWLKGRGVRTMLWSDMFLDSSESSDGAANAHSLETARLRRAALPSKSVVCDWHYEPATSEKYGSLSIFQNAGHPAIATTWFAPLNIFHFAHAAIERRAMGLLQSTWAGFDSKEEVLQSELRQFTAFVLAAEYAWSGTPLPPDGLPYRAEEVFKREWRARDGKLSVQPGWQIVLDGPSVEATRLPQAPASVGGYRVRIGGREGRAAGIALAGRLDAPDARRPSAVTIGVDRKAQELLIAHTCRCPASTGIAGRYIITFDDGTTATIPLTYGDRIRSEDDLGFSWSADIGWHGPDAGGEPVGARLLRWINPSPRKTIRSITLETDDPVASPMLLGISGIGM